MRENGERAIHLNHNRYLAFGYYGSAFYIFIEGFIENVLYFDSDAIEYRLEPDEFHLNGSIDDYRMNPREIELFQLVKR